MSESLESSKGSPHPDAKINRNYFDSFLQRPDVVIQIGLMKKSFYDHLKTQFDAIEQELSIHALPPVVSFTGLNKDSNGNYQELTAIYISWIDKKGRKHSHPISLHQDNIPFKKELHKIFGIK